MIVRFLSSATAGIAVTATLLWAMQALVELSEVVIVKPAPRPTLAFVKVIDDSPLQTLRHEIVKPAHPEPVPPLVAPPDDGTAVVPVRMSPTPPVPNGFRPAGGAPMQADSALINIINAQPDYPLTARTRGLEGFVVVGFDVTTLGTVVNVSVLESSHKVFEKAAIGAAYKSRYKPRTVDGVPQETKGLRKRFRFEMKN